jgi:hypothetical protein
VTASTQLFIEKRACVCCEREATPRLRIEGEPNVLAISFVIYRRGRQGPQLKAAPRVRICDSCAVKALARAGLFQPREATKLFAAMQERLAACYSDLLERDRA